MQKYMVHGPSDIVSNQLQWRISHNVASFSRLATIKRRPITVLGFIIIFLLNGSCKIALQRYIALLNPPNFWDILLRFVINGHKGGMK
jgi:hypothetical protein